MPLEVPGLEGKPWGYVAGTRLGKSYVSYYLMPVYATPSLVASMSPELRKRMQGKACFNFKSVDEPLFAELDALTGQVDPGFPRDCRSGRRDPRLRSPPPTTLRSHCRVRSIPARPTRPVSPGTAVAHCRAW